MAQGPLTHHASQYPVSLGLDVHSNPFGFSTTTKKRLSMVRDGYYYGFALILSSVLIRVVTDSWLWSVLPLFPAAFFLWFFRNPGRVIPQDPGLVVSPADGKVTEIAHITTLDGKEIRISIFLSVFDVHVNRSPVSGLLKSVRYQPGKYLSAMNSASAEQNEQCVAVMETADGQRIIFKLIAGLLARRIVFHPRNGQLLGRGELVGMIKFGSRCDLLLPAGAVLQVKIGDRVRGGTSILARLSAPTEGKFASAPCCPR
jgi:phosphatidylserine decarboxylase